MCLNLGGGMTTDNFFQKIFRRGKMIEGIAVNHLFHILFLF